MKMEEGTKQLIVAGMIILAVVGVCYFGNYKHKQAKYGNFQTTIGDLSDEQKCMHICGFQYPGVTYFDQYKFCLEKCDRISERQQKCGNQNQ